jgi:pyridoxine 5-phosphate synthase
MRLSINVDHIATVRQARGGDVPDPVEAARLCEAAGAEGIVCHLREDRRHINDRDVRRLREAITTKLDLEMAATEEIIAIALKIKPELATLVPEKRQELTTESGVDVLANRVLLRRTIERFHEEGILVSLFVDPLRDQVAVSKEIGADMIEIHTGDYANASVGPARHTLLQRVYEIAEYGKSMGLGVNAGHGLHYQNVQPIAACSSIDELSIGHSIISHALFVGIGQAVQEMIHAIGTSITHR